MKVESPEFTNDDIASFVTDYFEHERGLLIARLRAIIEDTESLVPRIESQGSSEGDSWNAIETLAHMATSSQFFGWLANQVASKKEVGDVTEMIRMRDVVGAQAAQLPADELAKQLRDNLDRTIKFLETVDYDDLRTTFDFVGRKLTAEDAIRIPLCAHLETHNDQIRSALGVRP